MSEIMENEQNSKEIVDFFCFSEDCRGTNYKNLITSKKCLSSHAECVLSSEDVSIRAQQLHDIKKIQEHKMLKNIIQGMKIDLDHIERDIDSVFFVQYLPELLKDDVIKVSTEFHNYFSFDCVKEYRELEFKSQFKIIDRVTKVFSVFKDKISDIIQKIRTIKQESLKDVDILNFSIGDFKILGNISEEMQSQNYVSKNSMKAKSIQVKEEKAKGVSKKKISKKKDSSSSSKSSVKNVKEQAKHMHKLQQNMSEKRKKTQEIQKRRNLNGQIEHSFNGIEQEQPQQQTLKQQGQDMLLSQQQQLIVLDDEDDHKGEERSNNEFIQYESQLFCLGTEKELQQTEHEIQKNNKIVEKLKDHLKLQKQIIHVTENGQDLNVYVYSNFYEEVQILKGKCQGVKSSDPYYIEENKETLFSNVKKGQIHEFDRQLIAVNLQKDGYLNVYNISNQKKKENYYQSETTITDFYSMLDVQEGVIYLFTLKQNLYKITKFIINPSGKTQKRVREIYSKNLQEQSIIDLNFKSFDQNSKERILHILLQSQKSLMFQESTFDEFSDIERIPYVGYLHFSKLIRNGDQSYFAIVGIDYSILLYNTKYQLQKKIPLVKQYEAPIDLIQISNETLLIIQKQSISIYNITQHSNPLINPKRIYELPNIENVCVKDFYVYVLYSKYQNQVAKKIDLQDIIKKQHQQNQYIKQEQVVDL